MRCHSLIFGLWMMFVTVSGWAAGEGHKELALSLAFDSANEVCNLTIKNNAKEKVTILDAFNKATGMNQDFPMGTCIRFKGADWKSAYLASSILNLDGFNKVTDINREVPMVMRNRVKESDWKFAYMTSSDLYDHGPVFTTERATGRILARPPQADVVLYSGDSLVRQFSVGALLRFASIINKEAADTPFQIQINVFVAEGETYNTVSTESDWMIHPTAPKQ